MCVLGAWDELLEQAQMNDQAMERLIGSGESFILNCASAAARRYITKSDDEWSVACIAFAQAIRDYQPERGAFLPFAELVIRRRLADYFKSRAHREQEILAAPAVFESGPLEESPQPALQAAVAKKLAVEEPNDLRLEIEAANQAFSAYGFSFFDLAACSPKAQKTRKACAKAVACLLKQPLLYADLRATKRLPIKTIEKMTQVPQKILDRHRKYIIAAAEILSGDYPCLAEYMRFIRRELDG